MSTTQRWTTRDLLDWMTDAFTKKELDSPRLFAELLISHVIGCDRLRLYMEADRPATPIERDRLRELVTRALKHEPVQYLVSEAWFFGMPFHVDQRVLVPRPSTETIIDHILHQIRADPGLGGKTGAGTMIADICTGSGAIAIALLKQMPDAHAFATDISSDALDVARQNATRHDVIDRLELLQGDLLQPLADVDAAPGFHVITANPPYIPDHEWEDVPPNVKDYEPTDALRAGDDGLVYVRPLLEQAPSLLRPGGIIAVEVAASHAEAAHAIAQTNRELEHTNILEDLDGLPRVIVGARPRR